MCMRCHFWLAAVLTPAASLLLAQEPSLRVTVTSDLDRARANETVVLPLATLKVAFRAEDLARIRVTEEGPVREVLAQAVDDDGDGTADQIVFQTGFEPRATKTFILTLGDKRPLRKEDFRVYGRFVRERFDDFAWENDRVAHRVYGPALETWQKEPLTSSGVDVWMKRTRALIVNDWYMVDDYHVDHGEGGDFYSVGPSRGCGGSGIWKGGRLFVSRNFRESRVFANGPIRLVFELHYEPWDAGRGPGLREEARHPGRGLALQPNRELLRRGRCGRGELGRGDQESKGRRGPDRARAGDPADVGSAQGAERKPGVRRRCRPRPAWIRSPRPTATSCSSGTRRRGSPWCTMPAPGGTRAVIFPESAALGRLSSRTWAAVFLRRSGSRSCRAEAGV